MGLDGIADGGWVYGAALSWSGGWNGGTGVLSGNGNRADSYQLSGYGSWSDGLWTFRGLAATGFDHYTHTRKISLLSQTAQAGFGGRHFEAALDGSYAVPIDAMRLEPTVSLKWLHTAVDGYQETGAGVLNLTVASAFEHQVESGIGARLSSEYQTSFGLLVPEVGLTWIHDFIDGVSSTDAILAGVPFRTTATRPGGDALGFSAALSLYESSGKAVRASYGGQFRDRYGAHTGQVQASIRF
jgi:outer membrane autotransporter protein